MPLDGEVFIDTEGIEHPTMSQTQRNFATQPRQTNHSGAIQYFIGNYNLTKCAAFPG